MSELEVRCTCARKPLLAKCGSTAAGESFIHVKAWKAQRLITEVVVTNGDAQILCRECYRWMRIKVRYATPATFQQAAPSEEILTVLEASAASR